MTSDRRRLPVACLSSALSFIMLGTFSWGVIALAAGAREALLVGVLVLTGSLGVGLAVVTFLIASGRR